MKTIYFSFAFLYSRYSLDQYAQLFAWFDRGISFEEFLRHVISTHERKKPDMHW